MLNIGIDVKVNLQRTEYPLIFNTNTCVHCGADNSLVFVDIFGRESKTEIHPFDHIKCNNCNRNYSIKWESSEDENGCMTPRAVDHTIKQEFFNILDQKEITQKGKKEFV